MKFVKTITILMTFCVMAFGSDARVAALGGNAAFWPEDDANVGMFPTTVNNLDMIQVSGAGAGNGSATVIWGEGTTWGFNFSGVGDNPGNDWFNLMWGNGTYGAIFNIGMSSNDADGLTACTACDGTDGDAFSDPSTTMDIGVSFGMDQSFGEVGVNFATGSATNGSGNADSDGNSMDLGFNLRREQSLWLFDNMLVGFDMQSGKDLGSAKDASYSNMGLNVDLFTELPTGDGVTAKFGLGFGYQNNTTNDGGTNDAGAANADVVTTSIELPSVSLGVEAEVTDWAHLRFGLDHGYWLSSGTDDGTTSSANQQANDFNWNFGLGFDYGSFTLDMVISEDLFANPMHFVTGRNESGLMAKDANGLNTGATLTWKF